METLYRLGAKPKRRPNLPRWFKKHNVSSNVMSLDHAICAAVEWLAKGDEEKLKSNPK